MAVLYYGPKRVFLLPFFQMLTDLYEIRQDLLLISLISIFFVTLLVKAFRNSVIYLSELWTRIPVSAFRTPARGEEEDVGAEHSRKTCREPTLHGKRLNTLDASSSLASSCYPMCLLTQEELRLSK